MANSPLFRVFMRWPDNTGFSIFWLIQYPSETIQEQDINIEARDELQENIRSYIENMSSTRTFRPSSFVFARERRETHARTASRLFSSSKSKRLSWQRRSYKIPANVASSPKIQSLTSVKESHERLRSSPREATMAAIYKYRSHTAGRWRCDWEKTAKIRGITPCVSILRINRFPAQAAQAHTPDDVICRYTHFITTYIRLNKSPPK